MVELMIVVAIITDLALIAIPAFERARKQAQNSRFASDLRVIATGFDNADAQRRAAMHSQPQRGRVSTRLSAPSAVTR